VAARKLSSYVTTLPDDATCGISETQVGEIKSAIDALPGRIQVVHAHWIFDVVTCGKEISGIRFPPKSPRGKLLLCRRLWMNRIDVVCLTTADFYQ
jgi:hypothetical protein